MVTFSPKDMKYWFTTFVILIGLLTANYSVKAQQAKAYETIYYKARAGHLLFLLNYGDGYLAASQIRVRQSGQKALVFLPVSGAAESNGDFEFYPQQPGSKDSIILTHINEEETAPTFIRARYRAKGKLIPLLFKRSNKQ